MFDQLLLFHIALVFTDAQADLPLHRADTNDLRRHRVPDVEHLLGLLNAFVG